MRKRVNEGKKRDGTKQNSIIAINQMLQQKPKGILQQTRFNNQVRNLAQKQTNEIES